MEYNIGFVIGDPSGDGTYEYIAQFYNGGTYLDEVLEDGIKNTLK